MAISPGDESALSDRGARDTNPFVHLERVVGGLSGGVATGRHEFKTALRKGARVAVRRRRSPWLLPTATSFPHADRRSTTALHGSGPAHSPTCFELVRRASFLGISRQRLVGEPAESPSAARGTAGPLALRRCTRSGRRGL